MVDNHYVPPGSVPKTPAEQIRRNCLDFIHAQRWGSRFLVKMLGPQLHRTPSRIRDLWSTSQWDEIDAVQVAKCLGLTEKEARSDNLGELFAALEMSSRPQYLSPRYASGSAIDDLSIREAVRRNGYL